MSPTEDKNVQENTKGSENSENQRRAAGGRNSNPVYELFVLGELMGGPHYGYKLHAIIQRMLGPYHRLSWGTLYPLIRRLEQQSMVTVEIERRRSDVSQEERGQPRKIYHLTETGRERFFALMLDPGEYNQNYPDLFMVKLSKFNFLDSAQQLIILQQYHMYLSTLRNHYATGNNRIKMNPGINDQERPYLLQISDFQVLTYDAQLSWLDGRIANLTAALDTAT